MTKSHFEELHDEILDKFRDGASIDFIVNWMILDKRVRQEAGHVGRPDWHRKVEQVIREQIA